MRRCGTKKERACLENQKKYNFFMNAVYGSNWPDFVPNGTLHMNLTFLMCILTMKSNKFEGKIKKINI